MDLTPDQTAPGRIRPDETGAWYCKRRHLLRELSPRRRRRLEEVASERAFQSRDLLFGTAKTEGCVHILLEGRVRFAQFGAEGAEIQLAVLEPGEAFHEPAHDEVEPVDLYVEAIAPGRILSIGRGSVLELVEHDPEAFETLAEPFR
jgi:CRP-like cAMP-binding protein